MSALKNNLIISIFVFVISGCFFGKTRDAFRGTEYCFDQYKPIDSGALRFNGYYRYYATTPSKQHQSDSTNPYYYSKVLFYPSGIALIHFYMENNTIMPYHPASYHISNDTIKILEVPTNDNFSQRLIYTWFKRMNDSTLIYLGNSFNHVLSPDRIEQFKYQNEFSLAHFVPFNEIPNEDNLWPKSKKWFWCDPDQYRKWKQKTGR